MVKIQNSIKLLTFVIKVKLIFCMTLGQATELKSCTSDACLVKKVLLHYYKKKELLHYHYMHAW